MEKGDLKPIGSNIDFVSEPITPQGAGRDTTAMARGEPGVPEAFSWRGEQFVVQLVQRTWKQSGPEPTGEIYLRRHYFQLLMDSGEVWTVYFTRQASKGGNAKSRWFLYSVLKPGQHTGLAHRDIDEDEKEL